MALNRTHFYIYYARRNGTKWIGLKFHFPLLWCSIKGYKVVQNRNEFEEIAAWIEMAICLGYYTNKYFGHLSYNWSNVHLGFPEDI